ncbi:hypothetical protein V0288_19905 [Pannus brasiliensis CCIBt3594]|uniref:Uncharacterized protein n=1 Tax=Pannus brasiliensis CCIBt3594 TaxID=1427578 RepID=A0AAW9QYF6_9CHRO
MPLSREGTRGDRAAKNRPNLGATGILGIDRETGGAIARDR